MGRPVLVAYASRHGSTAEVAEVVAASLGEQGLEVDVKPAGEVDEMPGYGGVVLGVALYTGRLHGDARRFLRRHREALVALPVAVFAMGPRTLEEADVAASRAQIEKGLAKTPEVVPISVAVFGGVVDPAELRFPFNRMAASDARDWDAIHDWAVEIGARLGGADQPAPHAVAAGVTSDH